MKIYEILLFITLFFLAFFLFYINDTKAYEINWKEYNIKYPENIEALENCYMSWQMNITCEVPKKYIKLIDLNNLLIKKWYNSIW